MILLLQSRHQNCVVTTNCNQLSKLESHWTFTTFSRTDLGYLEPTSDQSSTQKSWWRRDLRVQWLAVGFGHGASTFWSLEGQSVVRWTNHHALHVVAKAGHMVVKQWFVSAAHTRDTQWTLYSYLFSSFAFWPASCHCLGIWDAVGRDLCCLTAATNEPFNDSTRSNDSREKWTGGSHRWWRWTLQAKDLGRRPNFFWRAVFLGGPEHGAMTFPMAFALCCSKTWKKTPFLWLSEVTVTICYYSSSIVGLGEDYIVFDGSYTRNMAQEVSIRQVSGAWPLFTRCLGSTCQESRKNLSVFPKDDRNGLSQKVSDQLKASFESSVCSILESATLELKNLHAERLANQNIADMEPPIAGAVLQIVFTVFLIFKIIHVGTDEYLLWYNFLIPETDGPNLCKAHLLRKRRCKGSAIHIAALNSDSILLERLLEMSVTLVGERLMLDVWWLNCTYFWRGTVCLLQTQNP